MFNQIHDVLLPSIGSPDGRHIKLLVDIDLMQPLPRATRLKTEEKVEWVIFKHEQLPTFCQNCGIMGHNEKTCSKRRMDATCGKLKENQYREWIRATFRKTINKEEKPKPSRSQPKLAQPETKKPRNNTYYQRRQPCNTIRTI